MNARELIEVLSQASPDAIVEVEDEVGELQSIRASIYPEWPDLVVIRLEI